MGHGHGHCHGSRSWVTVMGHGHGSRSWSWSWSQFICWYALIKTMHRSEVPRFVTTTLSLWWCFGAPTVAPWRRSAKTHWVSAVIQMIFDVYPHVFEMTIFIKPWSNLPWRDVAQRLWAHTHQFGANKFMHVTEGIVGTCTRKSRGTQDVAASRYCCSFVHVLRDPFTSWPRYSKDSIMIEVSCANARNSRSIAGTRFWRSLGPWTSRRRLRICIPNIFMARQAQKFTRRNALGYHGMVLQCGILSQELKQEAPMCLLAPNILPRVLHALRRGDLRFQAVQHIGHWARQFPASTGKKTDHEKSDAAGWCRRSLLVFARFLTALAMWWWMQMVMAR
jgi:hypothetical protein